MNEECRVFSVQELLEAIEEVQKVQLQISKLITKFDLPPDWKPDYAVEDEGETDQQTKTPLTVFPFVL